MKGFNKPLCMEYISRVMFDQSLIFLSKWTSDHEKPQGGLQSWPWKRYQPWFLFSSSSGITYLTWISRKDLRKYPSKKIHKRSNVSFVHFKMQNRAFGIWYVTKTPLTKLKNVNLKYSIILHSKMDKTIKFERTYMNFTWASSWILTGNTCYRMWRWNIWDVSFIKLFW